VAALVAAGYVVYGVTGLVTTVDRAVDQAREVGSVGKWSGALNAVWAGDRFRG
jgi:fructose-1,6-bisphosphatase